jgi:hypothetical protein
MRRGYPRRRMGAGGTARPLALLDKSAKLALSAVRAERSAILELVETTLKDASRKADAAAPKDWSYVYRQ